MAIAGDVIGQGIEMHCPRCKSNKIRRFVLEAKFLPGFV